MPLWDHIQDKAEALLQKQGIVQPTPQVAQGPSERPKTPEHPPNSATPEPADVPSRSAAGAVSAQDDKWNFDSLKSVLDGGDDKEKRDGEAHRQMRQVAAAGEKKGGLFGKIGDILDGDDEEKLRLELIKIESEEQALLALERKHADSRDLSDKLREKLSGPDPEYEKEKERIRVERERLRLAREAIEKKLAEERANPEWHEKITKQFDGKDDELAEIQRKQAALKAEKSGNIFDKLKDKVDGESEQERKLRLERERLEAEQRGSVAWQMKDLLGKNPQAAPADDGSFNLKNKLNEAAGGGSKGEANEDKLDKAIDLFQQHVLKSGEQHNESAIEQKKDEAIADGIRSAFSAFSGKP